VCVFFTQEQFLGAQLSASMGEWQLLSQQAGYSQGSKRY